MEHTKMAQLPWIAVRTPYPQSNGIAYYIEESDQHAIVATIPICCGWEHAHAAFIVKACKHHDELVKALNIETLRKVQRYFDDINNGTNRDDQQAIRDLIHETLNEAKAILDKIEKGE